MKIENAIIRISFLSVLLFSCNILYFGNKSFANLSLYELFGRKTWSQTFNEMFALALE